MNHESINQLPGFAMNIFIIFCIVLAVICAWQAVKNNKKFETTLKNTLLAGLSFTIISIIFCWWWFEPNTALKFSVKAIVILIVSGGFGFILGLIIHGLPNRKKLKI